jgi:hypothetical protein
MEEAVLVPGCGLFFLAIALRRRPVEERRQLLIEPLNSRSIAKSQFSAQKTVILH